MGHHQRFTEFLHEFLQDFLKLFYPDVERRLDFRNIEFPDFAAGSGGEAGVVAKLRTRNGSPKLVLIHIEVQSRPEPDFPRRMFESYCLLRSEHKLPVFPIVVYLRGGEEGLATEEYRITHAALPGEVVRFRYQSVRLARLNVEEYRRRGDPVGAALGAWIDRAKSRNPADL